MYGLKRKSLRSPVAAGMPSNYNHQADSCRAELKDDGVLRQSTLSHINTPSTSYLKLYQRYKERFIIDSIVLFIINAVTSTLMVTYHVAVIQRDNFART